MNCPWDGFAPATIQFCERELCAWITQPSNTWSNIGFVLVGVLILRRYGNPKASLLSLVGISAIILGFGSAAFHASGIFLFEVFDLLGMFLISGLMVIFNVKRLRPSVGRGSLLGAFVGLTVFSVAAMLVWRPAGIPVFALGLAVALTLELLLHLRDDPVRYRYAGLMIATFTVSFLMWSLEMRGILCDPDNHVLTAHAVWHLFNAVAIYFFFCFYRQFDLGAQADEGRGA